MGTADICVAGFSQAAGGVQLARKAEREELHPGWQRAFEAERKFRRVQGWRDIEKLVRALHVTEAKDEATAQRVAYDQLRRRRSEKINSARDNPRCLQSGYLTVQARADGPASPHLG